MLFAVGLEIFWDHGCKAAITKFAVVFENLWFHGCCSVGTVLFAVVFENLSGSWMWRQSYFVCNAICVDTTEAPFLLQWYSRIFGFMDVVASAPFCLQWCSRIFRDDERGINSVSFAMLFENRWLCGCNACTVSFAVVFENLWFEGCSVGAIFRKGVREPSGSWMHLQRYFTLEKHRDHACSVGTIPQ